MTLLIQTTAPDFVMVSMDTLATPGDAYDRVADAAKARAGNPAELSEGLAEPGATPLGEM